MIMAPSRRLGGVVFGKHTICPWTGLHVRRMPSLSLSAIQMQAKQLCAKVTSRYMAGCTRETIDECLNGLIFGLPRSHWCYVSYIEPG